MAAAKMKSLSYFEKQANELFLSSIDYRLIPYKKLVLRLMKQYRKENDISWKEYRPTYDKWFNKYCNK